jgi:spermidine synthase
MSKIKEKINDFWLSRASITNPRIATNYREDGRLEYDIALVSKHIKKGAKILDLGAGTCTLSSAFVDEAERILAVDKFSHFLALSPKHPKLVTYCSDVVDFKCNETFDLILLFGVVNFLDEIEEKRLYENCFTMLKNDGVFIVKNQCGVKDEVIIDTYSDELKANYYARYPFVESQQAQLSSFFNVERLDIYPKKMNLWDNTHFYAFIAKK